jgi:hypothetical protein
MRRSLTLLIGLAGLPAVLPAQEAKPAPPPAQHEHDHGTPVTGGGVIPAGWTARPDEDAQLADVKMEPMAPGWHLTLGSAAILYREQDNASGAYRVSSKMHLFPGRGAHEEAFGLFIGGKDLKGPGQKYTYFLIRGDGKFKIKRRDGARATDVTDWTASPAITRADPKGPVANLLAIQVTKDQVTFQVNGQTVQTMPASGIDTDGIAGLRMNHNLSVHVETLEVGR